MNDCQGPGISLADVAREAEVGKFYLDRYEVTNRQYRNFIKATGHRPPIAWRDMGFPKNLGILKNEDNLPVTGVDFDDAQAYCRWADGK